MSVTTSIAPIRIAEIAERAAALIEKWGWSKQFLIHPSEGRINDQGALAYRAAIAVAVGITPLANYLASPSTRHDPRRHEFYAVDAALGDFLGLPELPEDTRCGCGHEHDDDDTDNRAVNWELAEGRTEAEVLAALRGLASAQIGLAGYEAGLGYDSDVDWDGFARSLLDGQSGDQTG